MVSMAHVEGFYIKPRIDLDLLRASIQRRQSHVVKGYIDLTNLE